MIVAMVLLAAQASALSGTDIRGDWINKRQTAIIHIADCPSGLCGTVTWSAKAAQLDAANGGVTDLDGTTVMWGFNLSLGRWRGKLYLPDQNRTVKGTIEMHGPNELLVKGCELGGLVCRSQTWSRRSVG
jgi:uncharacterized protein (DUF2147 family)